MATLPQGVNIRVFAAGDARDLSMQARLQSILEDIRQVFDSRLDCLTVEAPNAEQIESLYASDAGLDLHFKNTAGLEPGQWLPGEDVLFAVPPQNLMEPNALKLLGQLTFSARWTKMRQKKVILYVPEGCGPEKHFYNFWRSIFDLADKVLVTSPETVDRFRNVGVKREMLCTADSLYSIPGVQSRHLQRLLSRMRLQPDSRPVILIAPGSFFLTSGNGSLHLANPKRELRKKLELLTSRERYINQLAAYADWLVEEYDANVVLVATRRSDIHIVLKMQESMAMRHRSRAIGGPSYGATDLATLLSIARLQVTSHATTASMGMRYGVPMLGLGEKYYLKRTFRECGMSQWYLDYVSKGQLTPNEFKLDHWLKRETKNALDDETAIRTSLRKMHESLSRRANKNRVILTEWAEETFFPEDRDIADALSLPT